LKDSLRLVYLSWLNWNSIITKRGLSEKQNRYQQDLLEPAQRFVAAMG
jgi:hypothetical protein